MEEFQLTVRWSIYEQPDQLPREEAVLLEEATAALAKSYSPYSNFKVAAAVKLANGEVLSGANFENAAYPMCLCAERSVLAAAASVFPGVAVTSMAITVENPHKPVQQPAAPCGACRQVMAETEHQQGEPMQVILRGQEGNTFVFSSARDFLPLYFDSDYLR